MMTVKYNFLEISYREIEYKSNINFIANCVNNFLKTYPKAKPDNLIIIYATDFYKLIENQKEEG